MMALIENNVCDNIPAITETIIKDELYSLIIKTPAFKRLRHISFLGALDYAWDPENVNKKYKTRHSHSLGVAALAKYIAIKRNYSREVEQCIVIAALLHDIGHSPLSHSMEPAIKNRWGRGHHEIGNEIIIGKQEVGKELFDILVKHSINIDLILNLLDGNSTEEYAELFTSPINIDTIDGIIRSLRYVKNNKSNCNPIMVCEAAFLETKHSTTILDEFWRLKNIIYRWFILESIGIKSDFISQYYFNNHKDMFDESDMTKTDKDLFEKHPKLLSILENIKSTDDFKNLIEPVVKIIKRSYEIDHNICLNDKRNLSTRYHHKKFEDNYIVPTNNGTLSFQEILPFD